MCCTKKKQAEAKNVMANEAEDTGMSRAWSANWDADALTHARARRTTDDAKDGAGE